MKTFKLVAVLAILFAIASSLGAVTAQRGPSGQATPFCDRLEPIIQQTKKSIADNRMQLEPNIDSGNPDSNNDEYESVRRHNDQLRLQYFHSIASRQRGKPVQQDMIRKYQATLEEAVAKRREAIAKAQQEFRDKAMQLQSERRQAIIALESRFSDQITHAFEVAQKSCQLGIDSQGVRLELLNDIREAKKDVAQSRQGLPDSREELQGLLRSKDTAIITAIDKFNDFERQLQKDILEIVKN